MVTCKRLFPLLLACILTAPLFAQQNKIVAVLDQEQKRFEAMMRADTVALRPMLSDDLVYLHSNALQENKQAHLKAIASGKLVYQKLQREQASVRMYGKTALINGRVQAAGILNGNPFDIKLIYTAVYRKSKGRWLLANWQSTRIP